MVDNEDQVKIADKLRRSKHAPKIFKDAAKSPTKINNPYDPKIIKKGAICH